MNEDKATRYHRLRRRASILGTALSAGLLVLLLVSGASARLRDAIVSLTGDSFVPTITVYVCLLAVISEALHLPIDYYQGVTLERRYGLSTQTSARWWFDHLKVGGIGLGFGLLGALLVWSLLRWAPDRWWLMSAISFSAVLVLLAQLAPVVLLPIFYEFKPLQREDLVRRLVTLADRAGARVLGVFEWRMSDRTRKANAALAGIGRTRRILLSDTLLADHSDEEIEVILAHELAHHVHHDIWAGLAVETGLIFLGLYLADQVVAWLGGSFGLAGKADIAALPLLLLVVGAVSVVLMPLLHAISRAHERRADRYALEMTNNAPAFVSAMKRLGAQNLADEYPSRLVEILFYSHPPIADRIAAARAWAGAPGVR
ncbi:MAG: M48 family metalloprotease [Vicinamibacterales bacterium]